MSNDNAIVFDFALISATDMRSMMGTNASDWDSLAQYFAQVVVAWPLESDPTDPASYEDVDLPTGLSILKAMQGAIASHIQKPKILKRVLLEKWTMKDFNKWNQALQTANWDDIDETLKKVSKEYDPEKYTGEEFLMLIGSIAAQLKDLGSQGN